MKTPIKSIIKYFIIYIIFNKIQYSPANTKRGVFLFPCIIPENSF